MGRCDVAAFLFQRASAAGKVRRAARVGAVESRQSGATRRPDRLTPLLCQVSTSQIIASAGAANDARQFITGRRVAFIFYLFPSGSRKRAINYSISNLQVAGWQSVGFPRTTDRLVERDRIATDGERDRAGPGPGPFRRSDQPHRLVPVRLDDDAGQRDQFLLLLQGDD